MDIGVFIPIGNNGWLISKSSPQYKPSFELNREVVERAEKYGLEFALSMIKLRGFGGDTEFWDYNLESFTLMAGLAAITKRIRLYASVAVLTIPPAIVARMAMTIDSISHGRFGVNLVSGWQKAEYDQMNLWPGDEHFARRYQYTAEYVNVMKDLWTKGQSDFKGDYFQMHDCRMLPMPQGDIKLVCAGQSDVGMDFAAKWGDFNFILGAGVNTPTKFAASNQRLLTAVAKTGRDVGAYVLFMVIADETDEAAMTRWLTYRNNPDATALSWMADQGAQDKTATEGSTARAINLPEGAVNFNMGIIVGSYASVARMLDEAASVPGTKGIMLTFDDFVIGMDQFGQRIQPLMACRQDRVAAAAE